MYNRWTVIFHCNLRTYISKAASITFSLCFYYSDTTSYKIRTYFLLDFIGFKKQYFPESINVH